MNDHRRSLGLLLGLALAVAYPAGLRGETLDSLIARHVAARGGMERLEAIQTLRMSGRATAGPGKVALVTREVSTPGRVRTEFASQGVTAVYACDGAKCWYVDPLEGVFDAELMSESDTSLAIEQADILGPLVDWEAKGHSVELLGKEEIDGLETFKLKVTLAGGGVQTLNLDTESALLVRRVKMWNLGGRAVEMETTFSDFRSVGGVVFPHFIKSGEKGRFEDLEVIVEEAELNPPVDDSRFEMPQ